MSRDLYQVVESDFAGIAESTGVGYEQAAEHARRQLATRDLTEFSCSLYELFQTAQQPGSANETLLAQAALSYAPLLHQDSLPHTLFSLAYVYFLQQEKSYTTFTADNIKHPIHTTIQQRLGVDSARALGLKENGLATDDESKDAKTPVLSQGLMRLSQLISSSSLSAPAQLRNRFGVEHFSRYPVNVLLGQLAAEGSVRSGYELPVYVGAWDDSGTLWQNPEYYEIAALAKRNPQLHPCIYEVKEAIELLGRMAEVRRPACGFVSAHGRAGVIALNLLDIRLEMRADTICSLSLQNTIRKKWQKAAGMVVMSCNAAEESSVFGGDSVASRMAEIAGTATAASVYSVTRVQLKPEGHRLGILFHDRGEGSGSGGRLIIPPTQLPQSRRLELYVCQQAEYNTDAADELSDDEGWIV